jgi:DNA-directed RNA polymerase subunit RPC12/RpoP
MLNQKEINNNILYICGKCKKEVEKDAKICKYCGAKLGKIKCPYCSFTGEIEDFKNDTCPKCGKIKKNGISLQENIKPIIINKNKLHISTKLFLFLFLLLILCLSISLLIFAIYFKII